jgi:lysosomal-associated membrane protein 1/2
MLAELAISYKIIGSDKPGQVTVKIPANATEGGNCDSEVIVLNFFDHNETPFILSLNFTSDKDTYSVANITLAYTLNNETFNNTQNPGEHVTAYLSNPVSYLKADLDHSFACAVKKDVILSSGEEATLKITDMKVQAFMKASSKGNFGDAENCDNSKSRDIVPIAVGCALVGLVVIVLIAYLIGRRRSRQQGYQSV